ncbi:MAG: choice-of-anchor E domain-containing protein [Phycisphaeraceae bacterium]
MKLVTAASAIALTALTATPLLAGSVTLNSTAASGTGTVTIQVPKFDPSLGALISMTLNFDGSVTPSAEVFNISGSDAQVRAFSNTTGLNPLNGSSNASDPMQIADAFGTLITLHYEVFADGVTATPGGNSYPGTPVTIPTITTTLTDPSSLANFIGSGTNPVDYSDVNGTSFSGGSVISGGSGIFFGGSRTFGGSVSVTYDFEELGGGPTPVPTPAAFGLGLAALGTCLTRRR